MESGSRSDKDEHTTAGSRRRYNNALREERAAQTRTRILDAGSALAHGFSAWDWGGLTFRAVAERAGVGERTVYRHFPTERDLHDAVMRRLEDEAGVTYENLDLDGLAEAAVKSLATLSSFDVSEGIGADSAHPAFVASDLRRRDALIAAVASHASGWPSDQQRMATAVFDVLWSIPTYERLVTKWNLDNEQAARAITWVIEVLVDAIRGRRPS